jgi:hypothetical protein
LEFQSQAPLEKYIILCTIFWKQSHCPIPKNLQWPANVLFADNSIAPSRDTISSRVDTSSGAIKPLASTVVVINISDVSTTSLLDHASFCNTTFQPGLPSTLEKKLEFPSSRIRKVLPFGAICDGNSQSRIQHHLWYRLDFLDCLAFSSTHLVG